MDATPRNRGASDSREDRATPIPDSSDVRNLDDSGGLLLGRLEAARAASEAKWREEVEKEKQLAALCAYLLFSHTESKRDPIRNDVLLAVGKGCYQLTFRCAEEAWKVVVEGPTVIGALKALDAALRDPRTPRLAYEHWQLKKEKGAGKGKSTGSGN